MRDTLTPRGWLSVLMLKKLMARASDDGTLGQWTGGRFTVTVTITWDGS
jgi:hypothetical protein